MVLEGTPELIDSNSYEAVGVFQRHVDSLPWPKRFGSVSPVLLILGHAYNVARHPGKAYGLSTLPHYLATLLFYLAMPCMTAEVRRIVHIYIH